MSILVGMNNSNIKRMELKDLNGTVVGSITIKKSTEKKKKRLQYNFKELSNRVLQAKTSGSAHRALINARQKAAGLHKMLKNGIYDDKELERAILHAQAVAKVAKKREKHLQEEERAERQGGLCETEFEEKSEELAIDKIDSKEQSELNLKKVKELMEQYQELMQEAMEEMEQLNEMDPFSEELMYSDDIDPTDLERIKKKHRFDELREIMQADMKYLKALFDKLEKEKQTRASDFTDDANRNSVSLQLGDTEIPVQSSGADAAVVVEGGAIDTVV